MGQVYRARDTKLDRDVAIKVLPDAFAQDARAAGAVHARSEDAGRAESSAHRGDLRPRERVTACTALVMELVEGEDLSQRIARGRDPDRRGAADREADRRGARSRARAGHHPPRPEARQHQGARRRHREGARLRAGEGDGAASVDADRVAVADDELADASMHADAGGDDSRHGRLHEPGAGARQGRRSSAPTSGRSGPCCTRCSRGSGRSRARTSPRRSRRSSARSRTGAALPATRPRPCRAGAARVPAQGPEAARCRHRATCVSRSRARSRRPRPPRPHRRRPRRAGACPGWPRPPWRPWWPRRWRCPRCAICARRRPRSAGDARGHRDARHRRAAALRPVARRPRPRLRRVGRWAVAAVAASARSDRGPPAGRHRGRDAIRSGRPTAARSASSPTGRLQRLDLAGGAPQVLAAATGVATGGSWNADGTILFAPQVLGPLWRVAAAGGAPVAVTQLEAPRQTAHRAPQFLPDGRQFLFYAAGTPEAAGIYLGALDGGAPDAVDGGRLGGRVPAAGPGGLRAAGDAGGAPPGPRSVGC